MIPAGGADYDHMVSDHRRPVENCADWTTPKSGCTIPLKSGRKTPIARLTMVMNFNVDRLSKSINVANISMGISSTSSLIDALAG